MCLYYSLEVHFEVSFRIRFIRFAYENMDSTFNFIGIWHSYQYKILSIPYHQYEFHVMEDDFNKVNCMIHIVTEFRLLELKEYNSRQLKKREECMTQIPHWLRQIHLFTFSISVHCFSSFRSCCAIGVRKFQACSRSH